jgi:phage recombination protein Bet
MANELSVAERNALSVSYDVLGTHVELDLSFVKKYLVRGKAELVSDQEIILFMNTCKMLALNPLVQGEVYLIKYSDSDPATIQVGKGAYMRRAFEHQNYLSKSDGITVKRGNEIVQKEGCCLYPGEELLGGWCKVYFTRGQKERVAYKEVSLSEYNRGMANWKSKPATMINKVAISQCLREAFPKEYSGVYSEEELVASGVIPADAENNGTGAFATAVEIVETITQGQRQELFKKARELFGERGNDVLLAVISELGYTSTTDMPVDVWEMAMVRVDEWEDAPAADNDVHAA